MIWRSRKLNGATILLLAAIPRWRFHLVIEDDSQRPIELLDPTQFEQRPPETIESIGQIRFQSDDFPVRVRSLQILVERFA